MNFSSVIGQDRVKMLLQHTLKSKQIAHAYLFHGPEGVGKDALAIEFARSLICSSGNSEACGTCVNCKRMDTLQHPNLKLVFALPAGKNEKTGDHPINVLTEPQVTEIREQIHLKASDPYHRIEITKAHFIKINSIRDIKREALMSTSEEGKKIFIIFNADMMNPEASNSLLKTLEEPLPGVILLLTTSNKDRLLSTIRSRCQMIQCDLLSDDVIESALVHRDGTEKSIAYLAASLANGNYSSAKKLCLQDIRENRNTVVEFLRLVLGKNRTQLLDGIDDLASSFERPEIEQWFKLLQSWLRDALLLQQKMEIPLSESDKISLDKFVNNFPEARLSESIQCVEKAIAHLDKNVYLQLILISLAIDLRNVITENI